MKSCFKVNFILILAIMLLFPAIYVSASEAYTITFNPNGGGVTPTTKTITTGSEYGDLPIPTRDDYDFDGWYLQNFIPLGYQDAFEDAYFSRHVVRLATGSPTSNGQFINGRIVEFDVTINNTLPIGVDINDNDLTTANYTIDGNRVYGRVTIDANHYNYWGHNSYSFLDINCEDTVTSYTVNTFRLITDSSSEKVSSSTIFNVNHNVDLIAKWTPSYRDFVFEISDNMTITKFTKEESAVIEFLLGKGLLLCEEDKTEYNEKCFDKNKKLLFTYDVETKQMTLGEDVTNLDNIEYVPTEEDKALLANDEIYANKFVLSFPKTSSIQNKEYTITSGDYTVIFTFQEGHDFVLNINDLLTVSEENVESMFGVDVETFNNALDTMKNNIKQYGDIISIYDILIEEGTFNYTSEVKLKIELNEAMKKYNTLKLLYLDDTNNFEVAGEKNLIINADTADVDLDHLSVYALLGINETNTNTTNNPQTGDGIMFYVSLLVLGVIGFIGTCICTKKKLFNNN